MAHMMRAGRSAGALRVARGLAGLTATLMLSACSQTADLLPKSNLAVAQDTEDADKSGVTQNELQKATSYWGQEFAKRPAELEPALSYARNLKALGEKQKAMAVLQRAAALHDNNRELAGEYGRLALELDQINVAARMLELADDPAKPDWKVISARGTVLSKQGQYKQAIPFYERALALSNNQPSVLNNLAMAHAMGGDPKKAEELLRQAANTPSGNTPKVKQNLALVLGLQGRYDEAKLVTSGSTSASDEASQNVEVLRKFVKAEPKAAPSAMLAGGAGAVPDFKTQVSRAIASAPALPAKPFAETAPALTLKPGQTDMSDAATRWQTNVAAQVTTDKPSVLKGSAP